VILATVTPPHRPPILYAMGALGLWLLVLLLPQARRRMDARADRRTARHAAARARRSVPVATAFNAENAVAGPHGAARPQLPDLVHSAGETRRPHG
ncbi:hypothetical protein, partial [Actinocrinis sp.]